MEASHPSVLTVAAHAVATPSPCLPSLPPSRPPFLAGPPGHPAMPAA